MAVIRSLPWVRGTLLTALLALPWYLMAEWKTPGFLEYFIVGEHFNRFLDAGWSGDRYGSAHDWPRGSIWLFFLLASLPWGPLVLVSLWWRGRYSSTAGIGNHADKDLARLILLAALAPAAFFTLSGNILWTYVLPGLPFFAIYAGRVLLDSGWVGGRRWYICALAVPVVFSAAGLFVAAHPEYLRTQKTLVEYFRGNVEADEPLYYLDPVPFSARYYSNGRVTGLTVESVEQKLAGGQTIYLALRHANRKEWSSRAGFESRPLFEGSRWSILRLGPMTSDLVKTDYKE